MTQNSHKQIIINVSCFFKKRIEKKSQFCSLFESKQTRAKKKSHLKLDLKLKFILTKSIEEVRRKMRFLLCILLCFMLFLNSCKN